jgi:hypothetical protein
MTQKSVVTTQRSIIYSTHNIKSEERIYKLVTTHSIVTKFFAISSITFQTLSIALREANPALQ